MEGKLEKRIHGTNGELTVAIVSITGSRERGQHANGNNLAQHRLELDGLAEDSRIGGGEEVWLKDRQRGRELKMTKVALWRDDQETSIGARCTSMGSDNFVFMFRWVLHDVEGVIDYDVDCRRGEEVYAHRL